VGSVIPFKPRSSGQQPPVPSAATRPNKPAVLPADASVVVYRAVEGWPIHWRDSFGVVHLRNL
jgi:hypothetical protein